MLGLSTDEISSTFSLKYTFFYLLCSIQKEYIHTDNRTYKSIKGRGVKIVHL